MGHKFKGCVPHFPRFAGKPALAPANAGTGANKSAAGRRKPYSCNWRFSDSTSSDSAVSLATSASILRTAWSTVV